MADDTETVQNTVQNTNQRTSQSFNTRGGQQQSQTQYTDPYGNAAPVINGILGRLGVLDPGLTGTEEGAFSGILRNADFGQQFINPTVNAANNFLQGGRTPIVEDAYNRFIEQSMPTASGQFVNPETNPFYNQVTQNIGNDVQQRINAMYAGSGRDPSGAGSYGTNLGRGIAEGTAPVFANQYNLERDRQTAAINAMFGGGQSAGGLLSTMDQGNLQAGLQGAQAAQGMQMDPFNQALAVEAQRRGIPLQNLATAMGLALPAGSAFATSGGESSGTNYGSGSSAGTTIGTTTGTTTTTMDQPWWQPVLGAAIAGAGIYGSFKK